jgi:hypothetical protein
MIVEQGFSLFLFLFSYFGYSQIGNETSFFVAKVGDKCFFHVYFSIIFIQIYNFSSNFGEYLKVMRTLMVIFSLNNLQT